MKNYYNNLDVISQLYGKMFQKIPLTVAEINQFSGLMDSIITELYRYARTEIGYNYMSGSEITQGKYANTIVSGYFYATFPYVRNIISTMSGYFTAPEQAKFLNFNNWFSSLNDIETIVLTNNGR